MSAAQVMLIFTLVGFGVVGGDQTKLGPFEVKISSATYCGPRSGKAIIMDPLKIRKYNRTLFAVTGTVNVTVPFDDNLDLLVEMAVHTGNGWKENFLRQDFKKACSTAMSFAGNLFTTMLKNAGLKPSCPVPKGTYSVVDLPLAVEIKGVPVFWYGKYKFRLTGYDKSRHSVLCIDSHVDVVSKSKH